MASLEIIRNFDLYDIEFDVDESVTQINTSVVPLRPQLEVLKRESEEFEYNSVFDYPVIVNDRGAPWVDGNLYILNKLKGISTVKPKTLLSVANDLNQFWHWSLIHEIDFLDNDGPRLKTPLYRFNRYLYDSIITGSLASSTAVRRMNAIIQFYSWLIQNNIISQGSLWQEREISIHYPNAYGSFLSKKVVTRDLTANLRRAKCKDRSDGIIYDGGALRPLQRAELRVLLATLSSIGNTEMTLAFEFALLTGARLGSVFTLRVQDFAKPLSEFDQMPKIKIGGLSQTNAKNDKEMVLLVPPKLYERFRVYLKGERHAKRKRLSKHTFNEPGASEYVFLTNRGTAYYLGNQDDNQEKYSNGREGNAISQFVSRTLKPRLRKQGHYFPFKFHDLRATFGINLLEWEVRTHRLHNWESSGSPDYIRILNYIRERLGHSSISVTEGYLTYKTNRTMLKNIQGDYEDFLLGALTS